MTRMVALLLVTAYAVLVHVTTLLKLLIQDRTALVEFVQEIAVPAVTVTTLVTRLPVPPPPPLTVTLEADD